MAAATVQKPQTDTVTLGDGTVMYIARLPEVDAKTWSEMKHYIGTYPETAMGLQSCGVSPAVMRGWLRTQAIAEHYQSKLQSGDEEVQKKMDVLNEDEELHKVLEDVKKNGLEAASKYWDNEELLRKISRRMGRVPQEVQPPSEEVEEEPVSLHEAAKNGDLKTITQLLRRDQPVDSPDPKGITPLGYAIGANRIAAVKTLLDSRADVHKVDSGGSNGLHYAAGYGRKELLEHLLKLGINVNRANAQGHTALAVARLNQEQVCIDLLLANGATPD